eukprot:SAG25_NODE_1580_length_2738_cov_1.670330_3_plen_70_part_00
MFRLHKYSFEMSYLPADSSEPAPSFDSWEQSDRWRTHEVTKTKTPPPPLLSPVAHLSRADPFSRSPIRL